MAYPELPNDVIPESSVEWDLLGAQITPGQTASGALPIVRTDGGGLWVAELDVSLLTKDQLRVLRSLRVLANGGATPIVVPRRDVLQPWPVIGGEAVDDYGDVPFSDGAMFSDGSGFYQSAIVASVASSAALRATTITITLTSASALRGGESFSIYHPNKDWRKYEIGTVTINSDGDSVVTFLPPLREAVSVGALVELTKPRCLMRMADPTALNHKMDAPYFSQQTLKFVEYML